MCYLDARGSVDPKTLLSNPHQFSDKLAQFVNVYNIFYDSWGLQDPRPPSFIDWTLKCFHSVPESPGSENYARSVVAFYCDLHDIPIPDGILPMPPPIPTAPSPEPAVQGKSTKNLKKRKRAQQRAAAASEAASIDRILEAIQDSPPPRPPPPPPQMEIERVTSPVLGLVSEPPLMLPDSSLESALSPPAVPSLSAVPFSPPAATAEGPTPLSESISMLAQSLRAAAAILSTHGAAFSAASSMPSSTQSSALWRPAHEALSEFFQAWKPLEPRHPLQATLPMTPPIPAAGASSTTAAKSAAAAAVASSPSPLRKITQTAEAIAKACPLVSSAEAIQLASRALRSHTQRSKKKRARVNKRALNSITIPFPNAALVPLSQLPPDPEVFQDFLSFCRQKYPTCNLSTLQAVRWIHSVGYRLLFSSPPTHDIDKAASSFFTAVASAPMPLMVQRYQIKSSVFFRRIPLFRADGTATSTADLLSQLQANNTWASVQLAGPPRLFAPKNSPAFGVLYVDIIDDTKRTTLRRLLSVPVSIGTGFQKPAEVSNVHPLVPRCTICQRWGHSAGLCRSSIPRCARCAGSHDERSHSDTLHGTTEQCFNCTSAHRADSVSCPFYHHRRESSWIRDHQPHNPKAASDTYTNRRKVKGKAKGT